MGGLFWRLAFLVAVYLLLCQNANAATYHVGSGQTYTNLEALRTASITWADGDEIILYNDDNSLTYQFEFNGKRITISSSGGTKTISPRTNNVRFSYAYSSTNTLLTLSEDNPVTFSGFTKTGSYGGTIAGGTGNIIISGKYTFTGNETDYYGGAINSESGDVTISGTSTFTKNKATVSGSAVYGGKKVTISGISTFIENESANIGGAVTGWRGGVTISGDSILSRNKSTNGSGGAIASYDGTINISDNSIFSGNTARWNGGAIYNGFGNIIISDNSNFSNNTAEEGGGGAIYTDQGNVTISGTSVFYQNEAKDTYLGGGAVFAGNNVTISGNSTFTENKTNGSGGAIYSYDGNITISGTSTFTGNEASSYGGAIFSYMNVDITASTGDIVFEGNQVNSRPNAIFMSNWGNDKTLSLAATNGNSVKFYDPIESNSGRQNLTININTDSSNIGTVFFDMSNNSGTDKISNIYGNTTISYGTLALKGEAVYGSSTNAGTFELKNTATLLTTGKNNKINTSGNVTLDGTLAFDLTGVTKNSNDVALTLNGNIQSASPTIDIRETVTNGKYILIDNTNTLSALTLPTTFTYHGETVGETRAETIILDTSTSNQLVLNVDTENYDVTWTGNTDGTWNINTKNWNGTNISGYPITQFLHGDNVTFGTSSQPKNITVNSGGVNVAAMNVTENGYTFNGGNITGTSLNLNSATTSETTFQNEINFSNGITIEENNTLTFNYDSNKSNDNQFSGAGTFNKTGTNKLTLSANNALTGNLAVNVASGELELTGTNNNNSNINIATNSKLTVNNTNDSTFAGTITGNGNFEKNGTGTLTLTENSPTATGTFTQTGGGVNLQNGWGGNYTLGNSATLNLSNSSPIGGNANLSGTIDIINGKLNVGGDLVLDSGSILKMTIAENKMTANSITIDDNAAIELSSIPNGTTNNVIVSNTPFTQTQLDTLNAKLTLTDKLLVSLRPVYNTNLTTMGFESSSQSAEHYTANNNFRNNQIEIAGLLDDYAPIQMLLQSLDTRKQLEGLVKSLLAPELAAEATTLPLYHPYFRVFNHINHLPANFANNNSRNNNSNTLLRGQSACSPVNTNFNKTKHEFWFESYYQGGKIDGDSNALGYKTSRGGMMVGIDQYFGDGLMTGLIFGYGNPQVYNSTGKIEADDYTFGAYARIKISEIYANAFLGYGKQDYQLRRNSTNSNSQYNGDSMYASLELFKPIYLRNNISVSPLLAIDFQKSWSDGFNVNVTGLPLSVDKSDLEQTVLRIGVNSSYKNFRTRLQYGYQLAGDLYGNSRTSITGGSNNRILSGVNLGRHTFNAGFGGDFKIGNRTKLFADYDLDLGEHSTAHTGQFGFVRNF